ncbi:hypothetical protein D7Z54_02315 [Salibacterium salarium]|uniref:MFS transporter, DHA2 family, multidrug resistance protein n=1 Tax=Salibacterium salarium TaxID=284579 RepID=A0A3R9QPE6_9BACI|nr:MFS transporter [Salibacterium salarium]RSL34696.1 hypothetical protein D7Z54_02315 [Salibacterium salarium]
MVRLRSDGYARGYVSGSNAEQPTSAFTAIEFMFSFFPIIVALLMAVFLSFYKLDKEYPKITEELNATRQ